MTDTPCRTIPDILATSVAQFPDNPCIRFRASQSRPTETPHWISYSYTDFAQKVLTIADALTAMHVRVGDRVACIADNRWEVAVTAFACWSIGAVFVPMYEKQSAKDWEFILNDCTPRVIFTATNAIRRQVFESNTSGENLAFLISYEGDDPNDYPKIGFASSLSYGDAVVIGKEAPVGFRLGAPEASSLACLIYTSGTTGIPKGVMLTHHNIVSNIEAIRPLGLAGAGDGSLSFLPWAHVFGLVGELLGMIRLGGSVAISQSVEALLSNLGEVRPTVLFTVPSVFCKMQKAVEMQVAGKSASAQWLYRKGLEHVQRKRDASASKGKGSNALLALVYALAYWLIFRKVRAKFGGKLRLAVCGGAGLPANASIFVEALGILVYEGYGMTETSPIIAVNSPGHLRPGSGGRPLPGVIVTIDTRVNDGDGGTDGEIVVRGANVMAGYYNNPAATAEICGSDGTLRTGDLGHFDKQGFLHITGRVKDLEKNINGKYVAPVPIEDSIRSLSIVRNVVVHTANRPFSVALVVPNLEAVRAQLHAAAPGTAPADDAALLASEGVQRLMLEEVKRASDDGCKSYERVRKIALIAEDFTVANGLLTPTLKVKRRKVVDRHRALLDSLYI